MKRKITYISLFTATLLIGFVIGFLVNGRLTRARIEKMRNAFTEQGFDREFMRVLHPTPEQMEQLKPILKKYADLHRDLMADYRNNQHDLFIELRKEIDPYLTDEQKERLDNIRNRWRQHFNQHPPGKPGRRGWKNHRGK